MLSAFSLEARPSAVSTKGPRGAERPRRAPLTNRRHISGAFWDEACGTIRNKELRLLAVWWARALRGEAGRPLMALRRPAGRQAWGGSGSLLRPRSHVGGPPAGSRPPAAVPHSLCFSLCAVSSHSHARPLSRRAGVHGRCFLPSCFSAFLCLWSCGGVNVLSFVSSNLLIFSFLATPEGRLLFLALWSLIRLERAPGIVVLGRLAGRTCLEQPELLGPRCRAPVSVGCTWGSGSLSLSPVRCGKCLPRGPWGR